MENLTHLPKLPSFGSVKKMSPIARREYRNGMLFLLPWFIGFLGFVLLPMLATLFFTFIDLKITTGVSDRTQVGGPGKLCNLVQG